MSKTSLHPTIPYHIPTNITMPNTTPTSKASAEQDPPRSQLPEFALQLGKNLYPEPLHFKTMERLQEFRRTADYISAAMIFLRDNVLLERDLSHDDIKHTIGCWGISPGITLLYAHLNLAIQKYDQHMICLIGPNEGVPAILSCLWLEGSLERFYPQYSRDRKGLYNLITGFGVAGGFPRHLNAKIPGSIHQNEELGHVLSTAYGTVMNNPDLVTVAVVGDGEAETGATATAWHMCRYIDPGTSGAVLPILYLNCYNNCGKTIFETMENSELCCLFSGYGYQPCLVDDIQDIDRELSMALSWALETIREIQLAARSGDKSFKPRWPMIILRIPRSWGYPELNGQQGIPGRFHGQEVLLPHAKFNGDQLRQLQKWLASYKPAELLPGGGVPESIEPIFPASEKLRLGQNKVTWDSRHHLDVPEWRHFAVARGNSNSCLAVGASFLEEALTRNKGLLRIFSPDGVASCRLPHQLPNRTFQALQRDDDSAPVRGQVVEFMSEHTCQGLLQGYTMTGRTGILAADESLFPVIATMVTQYSRFLRILKDTPWRKDVSSLNYITTGTWTRPETNGLSHPNPSFIGSILNLKPAIGRVYLPPDANTFLSTMAHCLRSKNYVNLIVSSSHPEPTWLTPDQADMHARAGGSVWKFASTNDGINPDVVLVGIGADMTFEVIAAAAYLRKLAPSLAVRVVNVTDLMILGREGSHPHALSHTDFDTLFTPDRNIHFNYHGYANELQGLLFGRPRLDRITISSFQNEWTATTTFGMLLKNGCDRYHVAEAAVRGAAICNPHVAVDMQKLVAHIQHERVKVEQFIHKNGVDPEGTFSIPKFPKGHHNGHHNIETAGGSDWESHDRILHVPNGDTL
ncbi:putative phosphoketolase [Exophiala dermatitidis]|uniref:Phosphoketolase n=2 Tax=Exophiala dermatitidis TaxID=5970 RepID=H6BVR7_EXODN|nr:uncharacterized protein HMPREF1120_04052 [Exophiala dermatitidis NIH/UT8656]EHY55943.1 hypothetical protein HMPREF1120_04052 [Exophiala dermatitidis NIH/UT8656]